MIGLIILFYFALMVVISGLIFLKAGRDRGFYGHVFQWVISPLVILAGLVFIDRRNKKRYFYKVRSNLLIK
jgi:hypothetical protein